LSSNFETELKFIFDNSSDILAKKWKYIFNRTMAWRRFRLRGSGL